MRYSNDWFPPLLRLTHAHLLLLVVPHLGHRRGPGAYLTYHQNVQWNICTRISSQATACVG